MEQKSYTNVRKSTLVLILLLNHLVIQMGLYAALTTQVIDIATTMGQDVNTKSIVVTIKIITEVHQKKIPLIF